MKKIWNFLKEEDGLELAEYAVMGALIILVAVGVVGTLGTNIKNVLTAIAGKIVAPAS